MHHGEERIRAVLPYARAWRILPKRSVLLHPTIVRDVLPRIPYSCASPGDISGTPFAVNMR